MQDFLRNLDVGMHNTLGSFTWGSRNARLFYEGMQKSGDTEFPVTPARKLIHTLSSWRLLEMVTLPTITLVLAALTNIGEQIIKLKWICINYHSLFFYVSSHPHHFYITSYLLFLWSSIFTKYNSGTQVK